MSAKFGRLKNAVLVSALALLSILACTGETATTPGPGLADQNTLNTSSSTDNQEQENSIVEEDTTSSTTDTTEAKESAAIAAVAQATSVPLPVNEPTPIGPPGELQLQSEGMIIRGQATYEGEGYIDGLFVGALAKGQGSVPCLQTNTLADGTFELILPTSCFKDGEEVFFTTGGLPACPTIIFRNGTLQEIQLLGDWDITSCEPTDVTHQLDGVAEVDDNPNLAKARSELMDFPGRKIYLGFDIPPGIKYGPVLLKVEDINNDGLLDLIVRYDGLRVLLGTGEGKFDLPSKIDIGLLSKMEFRDLDSDGEKDLVALTVGGYSVLKGEGEGAFGSQQRFEGIGNDFKIADVTRDGVLDIILVGYGGEIEILPGNGDGAFQDALPRIPGIRDRSGYEVQFRMGDLNSDGLVDLVTANVTETFSLYKFEKRQRYQSFSAARRTYFGT